MLRVLAPRGFTVAKIATVASFKPTDAILCTISPFRVQTDTHVPCRGIRGAKSKVLHKEVIDKYKVQKHRELDQEIRFEDGVTAKAYIDPDLPVPGLENPYVRSQQKCILCVHNVDLDYKNTRLLSQFVSPHTGQIYGRQVTGLCLFMQKRISKLIKRSQFFGFMPYVHKDPRFLRDPKLFDPFRRKS